MSEFVKLSSEERNLYCRQASERMSISLPPAFIEKDFWVCWILNILNNLEELNGNITFKGGTSLSKAFGLIERFSEDIDIAINRKVFGQQPPLGAEDATSNRQRKLRIEELEIKSAEYIREKLIPILDGQYARFFQIYFEFTCFHLHKWIRRLGMKFTVEDTKEYMKEKWEVFY